MWMCSHDHVYFGPFFHGVGGLWDRVLGLRLPGVQTVACGFRV